MGAVSGYEDRAHGERDRADREERAHGDALATHGYRKLLAGTAARDKGVRMDRKSVKTPFGRELADGLIPLRVSKDKVLHFKARCQQTNPRDDRTSINRRGSLHLQQPQTKRDKRCG
jgi:hypothetical protein